MNDKSIRKEVAIRVAIFEVCKSSYNTYINEETKARLSILKKERDVLNEVNDGKLPREEGKRPG